MMNSLDNNDHPLSNFTITSEELSLLAEKNELFNLQQLLDSLQTSIASGITGDETDIRRRQRAFGSNVVIDHQPPPSTSFHELFWEALGNPTFGLLLCCTILSLFIGIRRNGAWQGFLDGAVFFLAIFLSLHFGAVFTVVKARCLINKRGSTRRNAVKVIRRGQTLQIPASEVVVGEVVCLEPGDEIPADGVSIINPADTNHSTAVFTGEKAAAVEGEGLVVVTAVGENTERQKLLRQSRKHQNLDSECSKFEAEIEKISVVMQKTWLYLSLFILAVQAIRCFLKKSWCEQNLNPGKGVKNTVEELMNETTRILGKIGGGESVNNSGLVAKLCVLLLALGDGLPLGIFITLLYASKKMNKRYSATARRLPACATIGLVTTICTTKTADLALHPASMADLWIGFKKIKNPTGEVENSVLNVLRQGIWRNDNKDDNDNDDEDEVSLLLWAENVVGRMDVGEEDIQILERKKEYMLLHCKGDAKAILSMCSHYHGVDGAMQALDDEEKTDFFNQILQTSSSHDSLRLVAFAYKQVKLHQSAEAKNDDDENNIIINDDNMGTMEENDGGVLLGIVALRNPYGREVRHAIEACRESGVAVKLAAEDDIRTSGTMAFHAGIDENCVFAESSPADQLRLIQCLRQKGEVVASTGTSVRQLPSLQESDVGIFMGDDDDNSSRGESRGADISLKSVNFATIFEILMFGRHVCRNIQKFIELQITHNVTAFTVTFILQISNNTAADDTLTPFQLLWVSLVTDTLGAYFLATTTLEYPKNPPSRRPHVAIITVNTVRNVAIQSLFQVTVLFTLICLNRKGILVFHCYALLQVFVLMAKIIMAAADNNSKSGRLTLTLLAFMVLLVFLSLQVAMSEIMAAIFHWKKLDFKQWVICVGISSFSIPIAYAANSISAIRKNALIKIWI